MSHFDEQPDGDPHGECAAEIKMLEARLAEIMPLFIEARDALPAISMASAKLHGVDLSLAARMDAVGTKDWRNAGDAP